MASLASPIRNATTPAAGPRREVTAGEHHRQQPRLPAHPRIQGDRSERPTGTSSPPSSPPRRRGTSRTSRERSRARRPCRASRSTVHHQPTAASAKRTTTSPQLGAASPRTPGEGLRRRTMPPTLTSVMTSGGPREVRLRQAGLPLVLDAEGVDPRRASPRPSSGPNPTGWNIPENFTGSPVSTPNGTMSSISKSIDVADADAVAQPVVLDVDRRALQRPASHRSAEPARPSAHPAGRRRPGPA